MTEATTTSIRIHKSGGASVEVAAATPAMAFQLLDEVRDGLMARGLQLGDGSAPVLILTEEKEDKDG